MRSLVYLTLGWIAGFWLEPYFYRFLAQPLLKTMPKDAGLIFTHVTEPFLLKLKIALILGLMLTLPLILREGWAFLAPGLTPGERRALRLVAPFSAFLFFGGATLGYYILPAAFRWFVSFLTDYPGATLLQNPAQYALFVVKMMLAFGIGFQLPIVMMFLAKVGVATPESMWRYWRHAMLLIALFAALLTPSGDALSMLTIGLPMALLYFLSISVVANMARKRRKRASQAKTSDAL